MPWTIWTIHRIFVKNAAKSVATLYKLRAHVVLFGRTLQCAAALYKKFVSLHVEKCGRAVKCVAFRKMWLHFSQFLNEIRGLTF